MEGTLRQTAAAAEATAVATAAALRSILPLQSLGYTGNAKEKQPTPAFTGWPEGAKGNRVLDLEVDLPVDTLFEVLWGPNAPVAAKVREKLGNDGYIETAWLPCEADAEAALTATAARNADDPSASSRTKAEAREAVSGTTYKGRCRMSSCHSSQMGRKVCSFERERCMDAAQGGPYAVETCVRSTATMADRFRCVFIHRVTAVGKRRSRWTTDFTLPFVEKTNLLLRKTIETGAHGGVKRNFALMAEVLREYASQNAPVSGTL